ncbi:protein Csf1p [Trichomonascus vanleenenianus]|uniref:Csf1p n=1 Tax=Trichomonascus vanleenenianus TaxID=2268995 RepID=UPI003ECB11DB
MDISSEFEPVPIAGVKQFSWVFIVFWALSLVVTIFTIFFFNRLVGSVLSLSFRWYLWHQYRISLKVQSIELSLLGGRLFFKNLSYVGSNEAIVALQGNFTWRYWLHRTRISRYHWQSSHQSDDSDERVNESLPTRLSLQVDGLEWFVFNRSAAYDALYDYVTEKRSEKNNDDLSNGNDLFSSNGSSAAKDAPGEIIAEPSIGTFEAMFLKLLPIQIKYDRGALVMGNKDTPSLLILHFLSGRAIVDAARAANPLDKYKLVYHAQLIKPVLELKSNKDYNSPEGLQALYTRQRQNSWGNGGASTKHLWQRARNRSLRMFNALLFRKLKARKDQSVDGSAISDNEFWWESSQWRGLFRYLSNGEDDKTKDATGSGTQAAADALDKDEIIDEYGKYSVILDAIEGSITYFYDIPGLVPANPEPSPPSELVDIGNGGSSPEWGITMAFKEATMHHGPWSDRQRIPLQKMLFPGYCADATAQSNRIPGQLRVSTGLKLFIEFQGDTIFRIPTREPSKNMEYLKKYKENPNANLLRPFGWIEIKFKDLSTLSFFSSMVATPLGTFNEFALELKDPEVRSSVNHGLLFSAKSHKLECHISYPLAWNGKQTYVLKNYSKDVQTFFIREHVTLMVDLAKDFSSGPSTPYELYTPAVYEFDWTISSYSIFLNINDLNIINNPSEFEDNAFVSFQGDDMNIGMHIPLEQIEQVKNTVDIYVSTPCFDLVVDTPPWHTIRNFLEDSHLGRAYDFELQASYTYYSSTPENKADSLVLDINGSDVALICYGFVIKYLMKIRENYFGENSHFQTLEEYTHSNKEIDKPSFKPFREDTDLDVIIFVNVTNGSIILPAGLYSAESNVRLDFATLTTDVRFTNYYMDLQTDVTPLKGRYTESMDPTIILDIAKDSGNYDPELFIDGLSIHGHRLFGLPPTEPTYFCKWDIDFGDILVNGTFDIMQALGRIGIYTGYSFEDSENTLLLDMPTLYDVTFLSIKVGAIKIQLHTGKATLELTSSGIELTMNDLANERYSKRMNLQVPLVRLSVLQRIDENTAQLKILAAFRTSLSLTNFVVMRDAGEFRCRQQEHILLHDGPFNRCDFLLDEKHRHQPPPAADGSDEGYDIHPSFPLPKVPPPIAQHTIGIIDPKYSQTRPSHAPTSVSGSSLSSSEYSYSFVSGVLDPLSAISSRIRPLPRPEMPTDREIDQDNDNVAMHENSFLPPSKWHIFEKLSQEFKEPPNRAVDLQPTSYYSKDDIPVPMTEFSADTEYLNYVINFGSVEGYMGPYALAAINSVVESSLEHKVVDIMDILQVEVLQQIRHITNAQPKIANFRILVPAIHIKYGDLSQPVHENGGFSGRIGLPFIEHEKSHLYLDCGNINVAFRIRDLRTPQTVIEYMNSDPYKLKHTVYLDIERISIGIRKGHSETLQITEHARDYNPFVIQVQTVEFWLHEECSNIGSLRIKSIDSMISSSHVSWVASFMDETISDINNIESQQDHSIGSKHNRTAYVVYQLSRASDIFRIEDDPPVLTKPSYIIRSGRHVRATTSWKILLRLRHIAQSVPKRWLESQRKAVDSNQITLPDTAKQQVLDVFAKWRSWELSNISGSYFFRHTFLEMSFTESIIASTTYTFCDIENLGLRVQYPDDEDYLIVDYLKLVFSWTLSKSPIDSKSLIVDRRYLKIDSTLTCSHVRVKFSHLLIGVLSTIEQYAWSLKPSRKTKSEKPRRGHTIVPALDVSFTVLIAIFEFGLETPTIRAQLDSRDLKMSILLVENNRETHKLSLSLVTQLDSITTSLLQKRLKEFREFEKVASIEIGGLETIVTFSDAASKGPKYIKCSTESIDIRADWDMCKMVKLAIKVVEEDYGLFLDLIEKNKGRSTKASSQKSAMILKCNIGTVTGNIKVLPAIMLTFKSTGLALSFRQVDDFSSSANLIAEHNEWRILRKHGDLEDVLLSTVVKDIELLSRIEMADSENGLDVIELMVNLGYVETGSRKVALVLNHGLYGVHQDDIRELKDSFTTLSRKIAAISKKDPDTESAVSSNNHRLSLNLNLTVAGSAILVTADQTTLSLYSDHLQVRLRSFEILGDGAVRSKPMLAGISSDAITLTMGNPAVSNEVSDIMRVQITTTFVERENSDGKDRIEFSSGFFHSKLGPRLVKTMLDFIQGVKAELPHNNNASLNGGAVVGETGDRAKLLTFEKVQELASQSIATMCLENVAIAWLFNDSCVSNGNVAPGMLFGYERFEVSTSALKARTTLNGVFITPALEEVIFYKDNSSINGEIANTGYLPSIELLAYYAVSGSSSNLHLRLAGNSVKVTLVPSVVSLSWSTLKSMEQATKSINEMVMIESEPSTAAVAVNVNANKAAVFRLPFSVHLSVDFEAAFIRVWDSVEFVRYQNLRSRMDSSSVKLLENNSANDSEMGKREAKDEELIALYKPALLLETPSVKGRIDYNLSDCNGTERLVTDVMISSSSNTIYPKAVPVVLEMYQRIKDFVSQDAAQTKGKTGKPEESQDLIARTESKPNESTGDALFTDLDINIAVRFLKQEITLSCLPTAKVAASVSHDLCVITLNTLDGDNGRKYFNINGRLLNFRTSLQHIYSREISGYVSVNELTVSGARDSHLASSGNDSPVLLTGKISDINLDVNLKQAQDLELFWDIWRPSSGLTVGSPQRAVGSPAEDEEGIVLKYRRVATTMAIPWRVELSILNVRGVADLGQSIGQLTFLMDRFWLFSQKSSNWEQQLLLGFDNISLMSEGRLGGFVKFRELRLKAAIKWDEVNFKEFNVPLIQVAIGLEESEVKVSLDYHTFAIAYLNKLRLSMSNQHDKHHILGDRLMVSGSGEVFNVYLTGLAASNVLDIYYTMVRMRKESHASYDAILKDSSGTDNYDADKRHKRVDSTLTNVIAKLRTTLDIRIKGLNVYVFPNTMSDLVVFVIIFDGANVQYVQEQSNEILESRLKMRINQFIVSLSNMRRPALNADDSNDVRVLDFVSFVAENSRGGTIISVPTSSVEMSTWQEISKKVIEYKFNSSFEGRVDVGWNLGSVNFIREMWEHHERAYAMRKDAYAIKTGSSVFPNMRIDEDLKEVTLDSEYSYVPREPPIIAAPQLRDMGEATPPIEWIGLNRQRFPGLTHQVLILGLQRLTREVDLLYGQVLGHS